MKSFTLNKIYIFLFFLIVSLRAEGQNSSPFFTDNFQTISLNDGLSDPVVYCFEQDFWGFIWFGTRNGLNKYDGYRITTYQHRQNDPFSLSNSRVNCLKLSANNRLYIGTDKGINRYDEKNDHFTLVKDTRPYSIKFIEEMSDTLFWVGTNKGLLKYNPVTELVTVYSPDSEINYFPGYYVTCSYKQGDVLYVGTYGCFCKLTGNGKMEVLSLPFSDVYENNLVLSLTKDRSREKGLWMGTEKGLIRWEAEGKNSSLYLANNPIKYLLYDRHRNLLIATDNGLFIRHPEQEDFTVKKYNSQNKNSLSNNVVWSIFADRNHNLWFATDNGISLASSEDKYKYISIENILHTVEGNQLFTIYRDDRDNLWLGGSNGLIRYNLKNRSYNWFRTGHPESGYSLSHNKVRYLYQDGCSLWIATDGGLNRYDYVKDRIFTYTIKEPKGVYNSSWMYVILDDGDGSLWLGTYEGGVFVVKKDYLLANNDGEVPAIHHYNSNQAVNALSSNIINSIVTDEEGNIWLGTDDAGVTRLLPQTRKMEYIMEESHELSSNFVKSLLADASGDVWVGCDNGLNYLSKESDKAVHLFPEKLYEPVRFLVQQKDNIWLNNNTGIACMNRKMENVKTYVLGDDLYSCAYFYEPENILYVGVNDGFYELYPDSLLSSSFYSPVEITNFLITNQPIRVNTAYDKNVLLQKPLPLQKKLVLNYNQNSFSLEYSSFLFGQAPDMHYAYRLKGYNDEWQEVSHLVNRVSFMNVPPGNYLFEVANMQSDGTLSSNRAGLEIQISPPWYLTNWAIVVYCMIALLIGYQLWRMAKMKQTLTIERIKRDETLKVVKMKMDFFTNVSHEFKTPLSLIIGHVSRLLLSGQPDNNSQELHSIRNNAQKLHSLINHMLDHHEKKVASELILSETSLTDFIQECMKPFEKEFRTKNIRTEFSSDNLPYYFMLDQVKMESVFSNLFSNAMKFIPTDGMLKVHISLREIEKIPYAVIQIEDNGCGIAEKELPRIFDRFYKAEHSAELNKEGSGIGLAIVKEIIEAHGGKVEVNSILGKGTTFTIFLSTLKINTFVRGWQEPELNLSPLIHTSKNQRKFTILLVEDNEEIRNLIIRTLDSYYYFISAANGTEGFEKALESQPDLVITDLMMPVMDGQELSHKLKNDIRTAFIPIIVLTAKNDKETEKRLLLEYVDSFIPKPFDISVLNDRIIQLILKNKDMEHKIRTKEIVTPKEEELTSPDEKLLEQITQIIEESLSDPELNVITLSEKTGISSKQLYRKLKKMTGMTVVEYIRNIRLKKAAMYLKQQKLSITEILYMVGFSNPSYFTKCFKEEYGVSPKEFMNKEE